MGGGGQQITYGGFIQVPRSGESPGREGGPVELLGEGSAFRDCPAPGYLVEKRFQDPMRGLRAPRAAGTRDRSRPRVLRGDDVSGAGEFVREPAGERSRLPDISQGLVGSLPGTGLSIQQRERLAALAERAEA